MAARIGWEGVFPAVTTQFRADYSLDIDATRRVMDQAYGVFRGINVISARP